MCGCSRDVRCWGQVLVLNARHSGCSIEIIVGVIIGACDVLVGVLNVTVTACDVRVCAGGSYTAMLQRVDRLFPALTQ